MAVPARCAPRCLLFIRAGGNFSLGFPDQSDAAFFFLSVVVVSLFHGLLIGSSPSFQIQRHAVLLMIIRSGGKTVYHRYLGHCLAGELATGTAMKVESISKPPRAEGWGRGLLRSTTHQWCFNPALSHWEERNSAGGFLGLGSCCLTPGFMGQNRSSALEQQTIAGSHPAPASTSEEQAEGAKVSRRRGRRIRRSGGEGRARCRGKVKAGKQFFGPLRSCYSTPN